MVSGPLLGAGEIRALARELGLRPSKRLGQNFVIDPNTVTRIARLAEAGEGMTALEVGPGLGSLTLALLQQGARVVAIEVDPVLAQRLATTVAERLPGADLEVIEADAMRIGEVPGDPSALVANLPYNVAVPVLLHLLAVVPSIQTGLVMVQKEVAERLVALPGGKAYGVPSAKVRWFAEVSYAGDVSPRVFWPEPNVDSGLVRLARTTPPACRAPRSEVFGLVDAAFAQRRKSLRSALAGWCGSPDRAEQALRAAGIDPALRGEVLTIADFARLSDAIRGLAPR
ncbi:MAG: 16S rRNA (adenine(1518)-N(6)/adenine(1519)-N(6))-dimethyltransferase RsmA [Actinomycetales bacterium]|nr:16S rRNA (adenine(1518)-N(6)/adenine(1519)-N(6))-dimethyltransferase RsmA [Actinomycetales bacterium]